MALVRATPQFLVGTAGAPELGIEFNGVKASVVTSQPGTRGLMDINPHTRVIDLVAPKIDGYDEHRNVLFLAAMPR